VLGFGRRLGFGRLGLGLGRRLGLSLSRPRIGRFFFFAFLAGNLGEIAPAERAVRLVIEQGVLGAGGVVA
jgi:hypothetical protein